MCFIIRVSPSDLFPLYSSIYLTRYFYFMFYIAFSYSLSRFSILTSHIIYLQVFINPSSAFHSIILQWYYNMIISLNILTVLAVCWTSPHLQWPWYRFIVRELAQTLNYIHVQLCQLGSRYNIPFINPLELVWGNIFITSLLLCFYLKMYYTRAYGIFDNGNGQTAVAYKYNHGDDYPPTGLAYPGVYGKQVFIENGKIVLLY